MAGNVQWLLAFIAIVAFSHFGVVEAVAGGHLQPVAEVGNGFQFQALGDLLASGDTVDRVGQVAGQHVLLGQVVQRGGEHRCAAWWLVLQAHFVLFAFGGFVGTAATLWLERGGVAGVGRQAVVEQVERADRASGG
ncbi:hypothetical protein D3C73_1306960 [compost metagenome]